MRPRRRVRDLHGPRDTSAPPLGDRAGAESMTAPASLSLGGRLLAHLLGGLLDEGDGFVLRQGQLT